jgi:hypothetical protein
LHEIAMVGSPISRRMAPSPPDAFTGDDRYTITLEVRDAAVTPGATRPKS